jgi:hypothetical protein
MNFITGFYVHALRRHSFSASTRPGAGLFLVSGANGTGEGAWQLIDLFGQ